MKFSERNIDESGRKGIEFIINPAGPDEPDFEKDQDKIRKIENAVNKCRGSNILGSYWVTTGKIITGEKYVQKLKFTLNYPQKTADD